MEMLSRGFKKRASCKPASMLSLLVMFAAVITLLLPAAASASVAVVNQFPATPQLVSNAATGTVTSGTVTVGAGSNRLMIITVAAKYNTTQGSPVFTVSYGGKPLTQLTSNTSQLSTTWVGYLKEADLAAAGTGKTFTVTNSNTTNLVAMYGSAAIYQGVEQTSSPFSGTSATSTGSATTMTVPAYIATGPAGNTGWSIYISNWAAGTIGAVSSGYTAVSYAGTNSKLAIGHKQVTSTNTAEAPTSTINAATNGTMVAVALLPYAASSLNFTTTLCSDCHGFPPADGTARNTPVGTFPGSHNKHSGTDAVANQYGYACNFCHYNATTTNHSTGFKNITGSKLPGNAYSQTRKIAISNSPTLGTCTNTYCHSTGRTPAQYGNSVQWGQTGNCLSCHGGRASANGLPARSSQNFTLSTTHSQHLKYPAANMNCNVCHSKTTTDAATLKSYTGLVYHADGSKDVLFTNIAYASYTSFKKSGVNAGKCTNTACHGGTSRSAWANSTAINSNNTCVHCHGVAGTLPANTNRNNYAPGWGGTGISTDGISANTDIRVGAHFVHLSSVYSKKLKCNECHLVPSNPFDGTHMATTRYNSQTLTFGQASTAIKNSVSPAFTAGTAVGAATCTTTYCHGSSMPLGDTSGTNKSPLWNENLTTGTPGTAECARCHGNPPTAGSTSGTHSGKTATTSCSGCHGTVVNASGAIINQALHMNGIVESQMACNNCHSYDATDAWVSAYGVEGIGAHKKHIAYIKTRWSITLNPVTDTFGAGNSAAVCGICHTITGADHSMGGGGSRTINFGGSTARQFGASAPAYGGISGTSSSVNAKRCSNLDCHYMTSPLWSTY